MDNCDYSRRLMVPRNYNFIYNGWIYPHSACHRDHRRFDQNNHWTESRLVDDVCSIGIINQVPSIA